MKTATYSKLPNGYRRLRLGERLRRGDKFFDFDRWVATSYRPGTALDRPIQRANGDYIRRR